MALPKRPTKKELRALMERAQHTQDPTLLAFAAEVEHGTRDRDRVVHYKGIVRQLRLELRNSTNAEIGDLRGRLMRIEKLVAETNWDIVGEEVHFDALSFLALLRLVKCSELLEVVRDVEALDDRFD